MQNYIIKNARVVLPQGIEKTSLEIRDGIIAGIGDFSDSESNIIDAEGLMVFPGAIDGHVHFREPGPTHKENFKTGSRAAVFGGVTTVFEMPNTWPTTTDFDALEDKRKIAAASSACNYGLFFGATPSNLDEANKVKNVAGLKIFMGCSTGDLLVYKEEDLEKIFSEYDGRICVHAEWEPRLNDRKKAFAGQDSFDIHSKIRDLVCATEAVRRAGTLAAKYGRHLHILHLSSRVELDIIAEIKATQTYKDSGAKITCEVCPHHLFFSTDDYEKYKGLVKMNPPVRCKEDVHAMWQGLKSGEIDMVATDHAPHTMEEKTQGYWDVPSGVPAVELMLPLLLHSAKHGKCTYENIANWVCHNPAQIYGLEKRGQIVVGHFADLVIVDPEKILRVKNEEQQTKCKWSPWNGSTLSGCPVMTIVNGKVVVENGELVEEHAGIEVNFT